MLRRREAGLRKHQVQRFYDEIWNANDKSSIPGLIHENFKFRGSLGNEERGYEGFAAYVDMVHAALGDYQCIIDELVSEGDKVFAKMKFTGVHRGDFLGYMLTGKQLSWAACGLFTFEGQRISDVWVLGDMKGLELQMDQNAA